nr:MAG: ORF1 [TTV-like mini virus]
MPPWYWRRRRRPWQRRRWRTYRRRRPRKTFRRPLYRRLRWVRRRFFTSKRKRKLKKIILKEWQPKRIRKCKIAGDLCLFAAGKQHINYNFTLYSESYVPVREAGGGAWSIMQLTLNALWDEYRKYRNYWTASNDALPLVKYNYVDFKFYRSKHIDYIVIPQLCPPFDVGRDDYLDTQPLRALMHKHKIVVRRQQPKHRKNYIKKRFYPPSLWKTKWYFQQEICKMPFIVLKTTAIDFEQFYQPEDQLSYNVTLLALSTLFENPRYEVKVTEGQIGYSPKGSGTTMIYLYGTEHGAAEQTSQIKWKELVFLGNTTRYTAGKNIHKNYSPNEWGNPFHKAYTGAHSRIFYTTKDINTVRSLVNSNEEALAGGSITEIAHLYQECRYNPLRDDGVGNKVYFKSTSLQQGNVLQLPEKLDILIEGFPLWIVFWSWIEWLKKLHPINHIDTEYFCVIQSKHIYPQQAFYIFLDYYFIKQEHEDDDLTETEKANWHPRYDFQEESMFYLAQSGPGAPKIDRVKAIQANCFYQFNLKWGGCPANMETFTNPCEQETFPIPRNFTSTNEIKDPETAKESYLYDWDERQGIVTMPAAKRIKTYKSPTKSLTEYGAKDLPLKAQETESDQTQTEEESETSIQNQLIELRQYRKLLKRKLIRLQLT